MKFFASAIVLLLAGQISHAQVPAAATLPAPMQPLVVDSDPTVNFRTVSVPGGRMDVDAEVMRAVFRLKPTGQAAEAPEATARAWIDAEADRFGWLSSEEFDLERSILGRYSTHLSFRQTFNGVRVFNRFVQVNLSAGGYPTMVLSGYAPHLRDIKNFNPAPALAAAQASDIARRSVYDGLVRTGEAELFVYPSAEPRLVWRVVTWPEGIPLSWEVLVDAHTGEVIYLYQLLIHGDTLSEIPTPTDVPTTPAEEVPWTAVGTADGTGLVFDPDPLTTAGVDYGEPYVDDDDNDVEELNDERQEVALLELTEGSDGNYRLIGPWVEITGDPALGGTSWTPPVEADPDSFLYLRSDQFFEAVNLYYHVDLSQRYVQSLDIGHAVQEVSLRAHPHGLGSQDNARYDPSLNAIMFGDGGIDDAEDADVIWHEYGHALLHDVAPSGLNGNEGRALHEGWGDFWAASYSRGLIDDGTVPDRDWKKVFTWDGNETWNGRFLNVTGTYPEVTGCDGGGVCNIYFDGQFWATSVMELWEDLGHDVLDRLILASHAHLEGFVTFPSSAEALLQADYDLYDGAHASTILEILGERGLLDPSAESPTLTHDPLVDPQDVQNGVTFSVMAVSNGPEIRLVQVHYRVDDGEFVKAELEDQGSNEYASTVLLPAEAGYVDYYVSASAYGTLDARLPIDAPDVLYRFNLASDLHAPTIVHTPIPAVAQQDWPPQVIAEIDDNRLVASAWVTYEVTSEEGILVDAGSFDLDAGEGPWSGSFPNLDVPSTGHVTYRVRARDNATSPNEATLPAADLDPFEFQITPEGVISAYDAEQDESLEASEAWQRGEPAFGLEVSRSGGQVYMTDLDGSYSASAGVDRLSLPPVGIPDGYSATLEFWHWYDFEHTGVQSPLPGVGGDVWDGGNVEVSPDGGTTWEVVEPLEGGYTSTIREGFGNPLENQQAYGGYSLGWRRVRAVLPSGEAVLVRFNFGRNSANERDSRFFAGWALDDIRILLRLADDSSPPVIEETPDVVLPVVVGGEAPPTFIVATDETGIESVVAIWTYQSAATSTSGTTRLEMDPTDSKRFSGTIGPGGRLAFGERILYQIRVADYGTNTVDWPADGQSVIEVRLQDAIDALAAAYPSGVWRATETGFTTGGSANVPVSSVVLRPMDLPNTADIADLVLSHQHHFGAATGGNVKISVNDGLSWSILEPRGGYGATFDGGGSHPMHGEGVLTGLLADEAEASFDVAVHAGKRIQVRLDLGGTPSGDEFWTVREASLVYSTAEAEFEFTRELALHGNYPNPFQYATTFSYTLPETVPVTLELFNALGQRVRLLRDGSQDAGTYAVTLPRGELAAGIYFLSLTTGDVRLVDQLVVFR